jgi:hypothetical protein
MHTKSIFLYCYKQCISLDRVTDTARVTLTDLLAAVIYFTVVHAEEYAYMTVSIAQ